MWTKRWVSALPLCGALLLTACVGGTSPVAQFYLLEPIKSPNAAASPAKNLIALTPVKIPHYLDRPQIVTASGKNAYQLSEMNRWAENLDANISRVLMQNLTALVPAEVIASNTQRGQQAALRLVVTVLEFHVDPQGQANLQVQWSLNRNDTTLLSRQANYQAAASTADYRLMVEALNQCLSRFSQDLATAIGGVGETAY